MYCIYIYIYIYICTVYRQHRELQHDVIMLNMQYIIQLNNQLYKMFVKKYLSTLQILQRQVSDNSLSYINGEYANI